jgi:hypothetical protein
VKKYAAHKTRKKDCLQTACKAQKDGSNGNPNLQVVGLVKGGDLLVLCQQNIYCTIKCDNDKKCLFKKQYF